MFNLLGRKKDKMKKELLKRIKLNIEALGIFFILDSTFFGMFLGLLKEKSSTIVNIIVVANVLISIFCLIMLYSLYDISAKKLDGDFSKQQEET